MSIRLERRLLYIPVLHIDTNLINARQKLSVVNQLEKWFEDEIILINMSATAHREAQAEDIDHAPLQKQRGSSDHALPLCLALQSSSSPEGVGSHHTHDSDEEVV